MEINVIDYSEHQLSFLSKEQLQEVKSAQVKKNRLLRTMSEKLKQEKRRLINNGLFVSYIWDLTKAYWEKVYSDEISWVRDGLLFYLLYSKEDFMGGAPYPLDYSLSALDRGAQVKAYYLETYSDAKERFEAYKKDPYAALYLCEAYKTLWDYFWGLANKLV